MASVRNKKRQAPGKSDKSVVASVPSPGSRLRQAREALGMEIATLAEQLHLSKAMVQALEEENYEVLPARVFVRGYYRNFARAVNVPEEVILSEFEKRCPEGEDCTVPPAVAQGVRKEIRSSHGVVRLVTWLVIIALATTFGLWWKSNLEKGVPVSGTESEQSEPGVSAGREESRTAMDSAVVNDEGVSAADTPPEAAGVSTKASPPEQPLSEEALPQADSTASAGSAESSAEETATGAEEDSSAPEPAPQTASPRVVLSFSGDCWVDVRGANKSFKMVGKRKAGEEIELTGEFPYKMVLGNARNVTILMNGKPYDLAPHTRGNVAKLTLKPAAD